MLDVPTVPLLRLRLSSRSFSTFVIGAFAHLELVSLIQPWQRAGCDPCYFLHGSVFAEAGESGGLGAGPTDTGNPQIGNPESRVH